MTKLNEITNQPTDFNADDLFYMAQAPFGDNSDAAISANTLCTVVTNFANRNIEISSTDQIPGLMMSAEAYGSLNNGDVVLPSSMPMSTRVICSSGRCFLPPIADTNFSNGAIFIITSVPADIPNPSFDIYANGANPDTDKPLVQGVVDGNFAFFQIVDKYGATPLLSALITSKP